MKRLLVFAGMMLTLGLYASELVKNGSFGKSLDQWRYTRQLAAKPEFGAVWDGKYTVDAASGAIRLFCPEGTAQGKGPYARQPVKLDADSEYELSCYVKGEALTKKARHGAYIGVSDGSGKVFYYGRKGLWKYDTGTFDWEKLTVRFSTKGMKLVKGKSSVYMGIMQGGGTVWYDAVSLTKLQSSLQKSGEKINVSLYPIMYMKGKPFGICENLPGILSLYGQGKLTDRSKKAVLQLDLPEYLTLTGVSESFAPVRNGRREFISQSFTEKIIRREEQKYRRYQIEFDHFYNSWFAQKWYTQNIFLKAAEGSSGRKGKIYWSLRCGSDCTPENQAEISILRPVVSDFEPCRRFLLKISNPVSVYSPFAGPRQQMTKYWQGLSKRLIRYVERSHESDPAYENWAMLGGNCCVFPVHESWKYYQEYQKKAVWAVNFQGVAENRLACWYMLDDADGKFEEYLRKSVRAFKKIYPDIRKLDWDFEPHPWGLDPEGRRRFARVRKLTHVPSIDEINGALRRQWFDYMVELHGQYIEKVIAIIRDEAPDVEVWLCTAHLHHTAQTVALWCGVDTRISDPIVDGHMPMLYYVGPEYFDDLDFNVKTLKKKIFALIDPSERSESYFIRYTPETVKQNIIAAAALGSIGMGLWPDEVMPGEYHHVWNDAYRIISANENFYLDGIRCEKDFSLTPINIVKKPIRQKDGRMMTLFFPDFPRYLRYTVHRLGDEYLFTVFNYHSKKSVLLQIEGGKKSFLAEVPANGVEVFRSKSLKNQKMLEQKALQFTEKISSDTLKELKKGDCVLEWCADEKGMPYFKLGDGNREVWIDLLNESDVKKVSDSHYNSIIGKGFLGRLLFYDRFQQKIHYEISSMDIQGKEVKLNLNGEVGPYSGAIANPLQGMKVERRYRLAGPELMIGTVFRNPTEKVMKFGFRLNNYPVIGQRFGQNCRKELILNGENMFQRTKKLEYAARKQEVIPFPGFDKAEFWNGGAVTVRAQEGTLKDELTLIPDQSFAGIFFWYGIDSNTVEFMTSEITLKPGESRFFEYRVIVP